MPYRDQAPIVSTALADATVRLTVRDFGPGVAEDHLPHLGEAIDRADAARQRATGGAGLGLYLCRWWHRRMAGN